MSARWYIIHAYSGFENKVAAAIKEHAEQNSLLECVHEVIVPSEAVVEVYKGKKRASERKFFPGYVLAKLEMSERLWHMIKTIPKVTGFLGGSGKPVPVPDSEVNHIFQQIQEGMEKPKSTLSFEIGEQVKVTDGPFESFVGVVEGVDQEKERVKIAVSIFGRATPVELDFIQVQKLA